MEFNEKLKELRKSKNLTQEELAQELFVSRTAISKWESGRGYPSIDSLKEISRFFNLPIDKLICTDEIITAAENDKKEYIGKYTSLLCGVLDIFTVMLMFIPVFGNSADTSSVTLFNLSGISLWIKAAYTMIIGITVTSGICEIIISYFEQPVWNKHCLITGTALSVIAVFLFIAARQPYAGIIYFTILLIKVFLIIKGKRI